MELSNILIVGIGVLDILIGGVLLMRVRAVEGWLAKRYARLALRDSDEGSPRPGAPWVPGRPAIVAVAVGALLVGAISIGVGLNG